jgi:hypothetical protein
MPVTDRLQDKNLIELAKQQYENKQRSSIPSIAVKLPSLGQPYPESSPLRKGTIEMRYMTAYDEDILTNSSYIKQNMVIDKLLQALILDPVDVNDLIIPDKEYLVIAARVHGYGADYTVAVTDPNSGKSSTQTLDLSKLSMQPFTLTSNANGEFTYTAEGIDIKFRFINKREVDSISDDHTVSDFLLRTITEVNGSRIPHDIENFIRYQMTPLESRAFRRYISENMPGVNLEAQFEGENGGTFTAGFPLRSDLLWL